MSGSASFVTQIVESAGARGVALSPEDIESINENLGLITTVEDGAIRFTAGHFVDLSEAVEAMSRGYGKPAQKPAASTVDGSLELPDNSTATERAVALNTANRNRSGDAKAEQAKQLAEVHGNPWTEKWANPTRCAIITNANPELAARLKREAGVRP